jgi:transposase
MRKLDFLNLIVETVDELRKRERREKDARVRLRVQLLRLLKSRETVSIKAACRVCRIRSKHGYDLWKKYRDKGLSEYLRLNWKPRSSKLNDEQQRKLLERVGTDNGFGSQKEARRFVREEFDICYTQGGMRTSF